MKFVVLSSGSKGNTTYVECGNTRILIDLGNTCKYVVNKLKGLGVDPSLLDGIFITHTHNDHVKGLKVFLHKFGTKVYFTKLMQEELGYVENYCFIDRGKFIVGDMVIEVMKTSHDAADSVGYVISGDDKRVVYITDTGYINQRYFPMLSNCDAYILESNHDVMMLNHGPYSFSLRQRILGDKGHLSNYDCARYLSSFIGNKTKCIVLAHLSQENNTEELALRTLRERMEDNQQQVDEIIVARQDEETEVIVV